MVSIFDYSECDDVADNMGLDGIDSFDAALARVRSQMPDESSTIIGNVAWSLWQRVKWKHQCL